MLAYTAVLVGGGGWRLRGVSKAHGFIPLVKILHVSKWIILHIAMLRSAVGGTVCNSAAFGALPARSLKLR